MATPEVYQGG